MKKIFFLLLITFTFASCEIRTYWDVYFQITGDSNNYSFRYEFKQGESAVIASFNTSGDLYGEDARGSFNQDTSVLPWEFKTEKASGEFNIFVVNNDPLRSLHLKVVANGKEVFNEEIYGEEKGYEGHVTMYE